MTLALRRFHLEGIGPPGARFDPLTVDLLAAGDDRAAPSAVLFLENGGGKTVLLRLLFSVVLAGRRRTLGSAKLDGYVGSGDTGHVALEWETARGPLVTGMVLEWRNRTRSSQSSNLLTTWYSFVPDEEVLTIETLPTEEEGRRVRRSGFTDRLRRLAAQSPALELVLEESPNRWTEHLLRSTPLDPETFRYQRMMNADEGEAESLFDGLKTDDDFVRFAVELIHDPEELDGFGQVVEGHATQLARRAELITEARFCREASAALTPLAQATDASLGAGRELAEVETLVRRRRAQFSLAGEGARRRAGTATEAAGLAAADAAERDADSKRSSDLASELRRLEATFLLDTAQAEVRTAEQGLTDARTDAEAWRRVPALIDLTSTSSELAALQASQAAVERDLEPLRLTAEAAAATLVRGLLIEAEELDGEAMLAEVRATAAAEIAGDAARVRARAQRQEGEATGEARVLARQVAATEANVDQARSDGDLTGGESPADAERRLTVELDATVHRAEQARAAETEADRSLSTLVTDLGEVMAKQASVAATRTAAVDELAEHRRRADQILREDRIVQLTPGADDLWVGSGAITSALHLAITDGRARAARTEGEVRDAQQRLDALQVDGLLPASEDVRAVLETLREAGIAATTGWRQLAVNHDAEGRAHLLQTNPGLAGGVVLADARDLERAIARLADAGVETGSVVIVGSTDQLGKPAPGRAAPIDPALYDPDWTARVRARLESVMAEALERLDRLRPALSTDIDLLGQVEGLLARCSPERVVELTRSIDRLDGELAIAHAEERRLIAEREVQSSRRDAARTLRLDAEGAAAALRPVRDRVASLAARVVEADELRVRAEQQSAEATAFAAEAADADRREAVAREEGQQERALVDRRRIDRDECRRKADALGVEPAAEAPVGELADLEARHRAARDAYVADREGRDLTPRIEALETQRDRLREQLNDLGSAARVRAEDLARTAGATEPAVRRRRLDDSEGLVTVRETVHREAVEARARAEQLLDQRQPSGRPRHLVLATEEEPSSADDASARAEAASLRAQALGQEQRQLEGEARNARERAADLSREADLLDGAEHVLPELDEPDVGGRGDVLSDIEPWVGSAIEATAEARDVRRRFDTCRDVAVTAQRAVDSALNGVRAVAADGAFAGFGGIRVALGQEDGSSLAARAHELAADLDRMAASVEAELADADRHREAILVRLATLVETHLRQIGRLARLSTLPDGLGEWSGRPFLSIDFPKVDHDELTGRLGPVLDDALLDGRRRAPLTLLLDAMGAAVRRPGTSGGVHTYRVRVLRPNRSMTFEQATVKELGTEFSGGMKLTAAICTYCALAALRANTRPSTSLFGHEPGTLFLDNPLGKASADYLLDLQHAIARRLRVQLVNTTGVWDVEALGTYDRVVRLRNLADLRRHVRRLKVDDAASLLPPTKTGIDAMAFSVRRQS